MPSATNCPKCTSNDLLVVTITPKGREMLFHTCRHCENRWWEDAQERVGVHLEAVIEEISS